VEEKQKRNNEFNPTKYPIRFKTKHLCYDSIYHLRDTEPPHKILNNYRNVETQVETDYKAFSDYIGNALDTARKSESIGANFKIVDQNKEYRLSTSWARCSILTKTINGVNVNDPKEIEIAGKYNQDVKDIHARSISINGKNVEHIFEEGSYYIPDCHSDSIVIINDDPSIKVSISQLFSNTVDYYGSSMRVVNNRVWIDDYKGDACTDSVYPFIKYQVIKNEGGKIKNTITIELEDDDASDISVFDVFFKEDVEKIYFENNKQDTFQVVDKIKEYGHLVIQTKTPDLIDTKKKIYVSTNLYQLQCQKKAIDVLIDRPSEHHGSLLKLSDDLERPSAQLDSFEDYTRLDSGSFKVLTKESLKGNTIQRLFVMKALSTPDFMILEGPPGSGKTTAILEFIYQVLKQGKKILLCASTHVAIDNVLEKIIKHQDGEELLKYINPVRIGDDKNVYVQEVKKYCYENVMSTIEETYREIVEDSFNLVCGTTIGILKYPKFKAALDRGNASQSIEPMFDYLIIDEASKTTFNEFLVPAIFAKKWIIVGDVKQLAPYVERNDLTPTLIISKALDNRESRRAIHFLTKLGQGTQRTKMKNHVFVMSNSAIEYIDKHLSSIDSDGIIAITNRNLHNIFTLGEEDILARNYRLSALGVQNQIIIGEEGLLKACLNYLAKTYHVIGDDRNLMSLVFYGDYKVLHHRTEGYNAPDEKTREVFDTYSKRLEDEIIWRLIRIYELTNNDTSKRDHYESYIESIKQYLDDDMKAEYDLTISTLEEIALPSIIMLLQNGIKKRSTSTKRTILNSGLSENDKLHRFLTLTYQYRMHEDISRIPRKFIYNDEALQDDVRTYDEFIYPNDKSGFEIRDITCDKIERNKNEKEADAIIKELKHFLDSNAKRRTTIAILTFYNGQVFLLRHKLQQFFDSRDKFNFQRGNVEVALNTVDKFQGQEADVVYLSMVQNHRVGFLDSVNRMNVAITRAKDKLIIFGNKRFFQNQKDSELLRDIFKEAK
jgi:DNA polymerase III delta prime subunit